MSTQIHELAASDPADDRWHCTCKLVFMSLSDLAVHISAKKHPEPIGEEINAQKVGKT